MSDFTVKVGIDAWPSPTGGSLQGLTRLDAMEQKLLATAQQAVGSVLEESALIVRNRVLVDIVRSPKTGKMYGEHQASAPGEAPAHDKGHLTDNIKTTDVNYASLSVKVNSGASYSSDLEFGDGGILKPRPYMRKNAIASEKAIKRRAIKIVEKRFREYKSRSRQGF